jgi:hypothetical protein
MSRQANRSLRSTQLPSKPPSTVPLPRSHRPRRMRQTRTSSSGLHSACSLSVSLRAAQVLGTLTERAVRITCTLKGRTHIYLPEVCQGPDEFGGGSSEFGQSPKSRQLPDNPHSGCVSTPAFRAGADHAAAQVLDAPTDSQQQVASPKVSGHGRTVTLIAGLIDAQRVVQ